MLTGRKETILVDILIKNMHRNKPQYAFEFKVDRTTPVGNPYSMTKGYTRQEACDKYMLEFEERLKEPEFKAYIDDMIKAYNRYGRLHLFCWCVPLRCHAETIKRYILSQVQQ